MNKSRAELDTQLKKLETLLPGLVQQYTNDADFWVAFAGMADRIKNAALADDYTYVRERIDAMLATQGLASI